MYITTFILAVMLKHLAFLLPKTSMCPKWLPLNKDYLEPKNYLKVQKWQDNSWSGDRHHTVPPVHHWMTIPELLLLFMNNGSSCNQISGHCLLWSATSNNYPAYSPSYLIIIPNQMVSSCNIFTKSSRIRWTLPRFFSQVFCRIAPRLECLLWNPFFVAHSLSNRHKVENFYTEWRYIADCSFRNPKRETDKTVKKHDLLVINPGMHKTLAILFDVCSTKYFLSGNTCLLVYLALSLW